MFRLFLYFFIFCIGFTQISCNAKKDTSTDKAEKDSAELVKENLSSLTENSIQLEDLDIYGNYNDIASIFEQKNDTTYIINFWATWCKPCVEELPYFEKVIEDFEGEKIKVILVSLDFPNQIESKLLPFMNERKLKSDVIVLTDGDYNTWIDKVDIEWGGAIPITVVYNKNDRNFIGRQFENEAELHKIVEGFVKSGQ